MREQTQLFAKGFINSYSQLFFADNKAFAWLLLLSSFVNPSTGLCGIIAILVSFLMAWLIGLNRTLISYGVYTYNALMLGLVLGSQYNITPTLLVMLFTGSILSVFLVVWLNTLLAKYKLPSLSLSFLLTYWIIVLCIRNLNGIEASEVGIFRYNEWYRVGGQDLVDFMLELENISWPAFIQSYLKSLSAIFFQYNILAGIIILVGLIIWSRIGFVLSLLGFAVGYIFCSTFSGDFSDLTYSYIGFNFMLSAVAIGGFYTIPSRSSFLLTIVTMPIIVVLINAFNGLLGVYQLPLYSLPFVVTVLLVILLLQQRTQAKHLALVTYQYFSPEKNLYQHHSSLSRFKNKPLFHIQLPFFGEWFVSQGYNGSVTHREDWKEALDFVVADELNHTFKLPGKQLTDFYCYNLPVLAPADGYVAEILEGIDDNEIDDVNLGHNWGNTVVIKHGEGLYTKLSHLKKQSITLKVNDYVKQGQVIGTCGNSGRSPEPHLHFQIQASPFVGAKTLAYPLAYYVSRNGTSYTFHAYETPKEGSRIHNPVKTSLLMQALHFVPGQKIKWQVETTGQETEEVEWECMVNAWNQTYLYCSHTKAIAYYVNDGTLFYFTDFIGDKQSLLFEFYLAAQKIALGYYEKMKIYDTIPLDTFHHKGLLVLHDLIAPFYIFMQVKYQSQFIAADDAYSPKTISMSSRVDAQLLNKPVKSKTYTLRFESEHLQEWEIMENNQPPKKIRWVE